MRTARRYINRYYGEWYIAIGLCFTITSCKILIVEILPGASALLLPRTTSDNAIMSDNDELQQIAHLRREYVRGGLCRQDLPAEPLALFERWLKQACEAKLADPTAMVVATVDEYSQPWQRIVLLKHYDAKGLVFYTNLGSRKAYHIEYNPRVSLLFPWHLLERQVMVIGRAERLSMIEVIKYFHSRPRDSKISAWVSKQSKRISSRGVLESKFLELKQKFQQGEIPFPSFWGGFRIYVEQMEFWQGGKHRLHDRFLYQRDNEAWKIDRLAP